MSARSIKYSVDFLLEELGKSNVTLDFLIYGTYYPGRQDPWLDPGDPDEFEIESVEVVSAWGSNWHYFRKDRTDWFKALDDIILNKVLDDPYFESQCMERLEWLEKDDD